MRKTLSPRPPSAPGDSAPATPVNVPSSTGTGPKPAAPRVTPRGSSKQRILLAIRDDKIDFKEMSPEAVKQLNEILHKPEVQQQFGIGPLSQKFDPQHAARIYHALGKVFSTLGRVALRSDAAASKLEYTE